jgi:hypothetical protein
MSRSSYPGQTSDELADQLSALTLASQTPHSILRPQRPPLPRSANIPIPVLRIDANGHTQRLPHSFLPAQAAPRTVRFYGG